MYQNMNHLILVGVLLPGLFLLMQVHSKPQGSRCNNSGSPGTCILMPDCPIALKAVQEQGYHELKRCGFKKDTEIVCCPSDFRHPKPDRPDIDEKPEIRGSEPASKSEKACKKYSESLPIILTYHIVEGQDAEAGEFPHMAALGFYSKDDRLYKFDCGGTLISPGYLITAAHCIINVDQNPLKIARLGVLNVTGSIENPDPSLDHNVLNVTVHQDYNWKEKLNDLALAKLEKEVTFTNFIRPACLYTRNDDPERLMVTGWGAVSLGGERSFILQKATLNAVGLQECNSTYQTRTKRYVTKSQICAADNVSDACQGDSGGPLQTQSSTSILTIVGVTSYGIGCGSKYPGVYTRVSSYLTWIEGIVWPSDI